MGTFSTYIPKHVIYKDDLFNWSLVICIIKEEVCKKKILENKDLQEIPYSSLHFLYSLLETDTLLLILLLF